MKVNDAGNLSLQAATPPSRTVLTNHYVRTFENSQSFIFQYKFLQVFLVFLVIGQACFVMIWEVDVDEKSRFGFWRQYRKAQTMMPNNAGELRMSETVPRISRIG